MSLHLIEYDRSTKSMITLAFLPLGFVISARITLLCALNDDSSSPAHLGGAQLEAGTRFNMDELSELLLHVLEGRSFFFLLNCLKWSIRDQTIPA